MFILISTDKCSFHSSSMKHIFAADGYYSCSKCRERMAVSFVASVNKSTAQLLHLRFRKCHSKNLRARGLEYLL